MEFGELVKERRSVRSYKEAIVSASDMSEIIRCALMAPSWKNSETGRYYAALSPESIEAVKKALPDFNQKSSENASYIVTAFKKGLSGYGNGAPADEYGEIWGGYDLGLQNAYLMLKARELGYDTLVMGLRDEEKLRKIFNIPDDEIVLGVIAIGKRNEDPTLRPRKDVTEVLVIK